MSKFTYLVSDGGPHMLLPSEAAGAWSGGPVQYATACSAVASAKMATLSVGSTSAMVLSNPPMSAWGTSADGLVEVYCLDSVTSTNLDALITTATAAVPTTSMSNSGRTLSLRQPDAYLMFTGDSTTSTAYGVYRVPLPVGKYNILVGTYSSGGQSVTIYRLQPGAG